MILKVNTPEEIPFDTMNPGAIVYLQSPNATQLAKAFELMDKAASSRGLQPYVGVRKMEQFAFGLTSPSTGKKRTTNQSPGRPQGLERKSLAALQPGQCVTLQLNGRSPQSIRNMVSQHSKKHGQKFAAKKTGDDSFLVIRLP